MWGSGVAQGWFASCEASILSVIHPYDPAHRDGYRDGYRDGIEMATASQDQTP